jgi:putative ABC transport system substrate-binding protein
MHDLGYVDGQNLEMLYRYADLQPDRLTQVAEELVQLRPDVLVGGASISTVALKKATDTIPIVIAALADAIELGLIKTSAAGRECHGHNALCRWFANETA